MGGLFFLVSSVLCLPSVLAQCPPVQTPCSCSPSVYEPVSIVCENAGSLPNAIRAIAPARDIQIDSLTIRNTPITRLGAFSFQGFSIIRLVLNRNTMSDIDPQAFEGPLIESLLELDMRDNQLGRIPIRGVPRLRSLRRLYLNRNRISSVPANVFAQYESRDMLLKLDLSGNQITDSGLGANPFSALTNLEELSLEANSLTRIPTSALRPLRQNMKDLNLGLNNITNVGPGQLDFPRLQSLSLEFNGISRIPAEAFRQIPNLLYLYITGNRFPSWDPNMFRYVGGLQILGIGETPITTIPANAFVNIRSLKRLEMSEAAVDTIQIGAFQQTPEIEVIVLNKNRLQRIRADMFRGLQRLYSLDLQGNQLNFVEDFSWAQLPALRHLDISSNNLEVLTPNTFQGTFLPTLDVRTLFICDNPWVCDERLAWFRQWLRDNMDIQIDKPGCMSVCVAPAFFPPNWPIRNPDPIFSTVFPPTSQPIIRSASSIPFWIILAIILAILLTSICVLSIVRFFVSRRRKKFKDDEEEEEQRIISSTASGYHAGSVAGSAYPVASGYPGSAIDLDLPPANTLDDRQQNYLTY